MEAFMQFFMMFFVVAFAVVAVGANYLKHRLDAAIEGSVSYSSISDPQRSDVRAPRHSPAWDDEFARTA